jgi:hypothetical protein
MDLPKGGRADEAEMASDNFSEGILVAITAILSEQLEIIFVHSNNLSPLPYEIRQHLSGVVALFPDQSN